MTTQFYNIQGLRFFAAISVAMYHLFPRQLTNLDPEGFAVELGRFLFLGVDIFFVISGFVIYLVGSKQTSAINFYWRRIVRIFSTYWVILLLWVLISAYYGADRLEGKSLLGSVFLFEVGHKQNVLWIAWTLTFEMFFYTFFAIVILIMPRAKILGIALLFFAHLIFYQFSKLKLLEFGGVLHNQLILEFCFGAMAAYFMNIRLSARSAALITTAGTGIIVMAVAISMSIPPTLNRVAFFGVGSTLLIFGLAQLEVHGRSIGNGLLALLGDASYSLYLLHPLVFMLVERSFVRKSINSIELLQGPFYVVVVTLLLIFAAVVMHLKLHRNT